ncbi:MAG: hypothetical protein MJ248_06455 [Bacilli bacterium]|nr:hypothetical protein [Bacilli bacterium]
MKNNKLIVGLSVALLFSLAACGKGSGSNTTTNTGTDTATDTNTGSDTTPVKNERLQNALDSFGTNFTVSFVTASSDDTDYAPQLRLGDGLFVNCYQGNFSGYVKVESDSEYYHYFDHNNREYESPWNFDYFDFGGRRDFTDADLLKASKLTNYFDESKYEAVSENVYHSNDETEILTFLRAVNTDFGYGMFGFGKGGVTINLKDDGSLDNVELYGYNGGIEGAEVDLNALWATFEFSNIGTTTDEAVTEYLAGLDSLPEPDYSDIKQISRNGEALYEGLEFDFEYTCPVDYVGEDGKYLALWSDAGYTSFLTSETEKFPDCKVNENVPANFTGTITAKNGHIEVKDIKDVAYEDDYLMLWPNEVSEGGYWVDEFASPKYGPSYTGALVSLSSLTFEGGTVSETKGTTDDLKFSYVFCGAKVEITVRFDATTSEVQRNAWNTFVSDSNIAQGSAVNVNNGVFVWENGEPVVYFGENTFAEEGYSFEDAVYDLCEEEVPMYTGNLGVEFFFDTMVPGDDDKQYLGVVGIIDIQNDKVDSLVAGYASQLESAGYTKANQFIDEGVVVTQYTKGDIVVLYTSPMTDDGSYYYYQVQVVNLSKEYIEPEVFSWVGTYEIVLADDTEITLTVQDDGFAYIGEEEFQWMSFGSLWVYNDSKEFTINYDEFADEYTGYDGAGDSFKSVVRY